jgi:rhodanese-related sulfurtransferase
MRTRIVWLLALGLALASCGGSTATAVGVTEVVPDRAQQVIEEAPAGLVVLDVRTPEEFAEGHLTGAVNVDFYAADFGDRLAELDPTLPYVLYCRSGNRSGTTAEMMTELGFEEVYEVDGGILAWAAAGHAVNDGVLGGSAE